MLADVLSRAFLKDAVPDEECRSWCNIWWGISSSDSHGIQQQWSYWYKSRRIRRSTGDDHMLSELGEKIQNGWPSRRDEVNDELNQYWSYRGELSIINGIIFKSARVAIPKKLRSEMLKQHHILHIGIKKTKLRARESMFWPGMNSEIEVW